VQQIWNTLCQPDCNRAQFVASISGLSELRGILALCSFSDDKGPETPQNTLLGMAVSHPHRCHRTAGSLRHGEPGCCHHVLAVVLSVTTASTRTLTCSDTSAHTTTATTSSRVKRIEHKSRLDEHTRTHSECMRALRSCLRYLHCRMEAVQDNAPVAAGAGTQQRPASRGAPSPRTSATTLQCALPVLCEITGSFGRAWLYQLSCLSLCTRPALAAQGRDLTAHAMAE